MSDQSQKQQDKTELKKVTKISKGIRHGPINRLFGPIDLGNDLKPFIFLDYLRANIPENFGFGLHPHSGIATLTYQLDVDVAFTDTEGRGGVLKATGLEFMQAGGGAWHGGQMLRGGEVSGFQLWIALPEEVEDQESFSQYVAPEEVSEFDNVKILLGEYCGVRSILKTPSEMNYFDIELNERTRKFEFEVPSSHEVCWAFVYKGEVSINNSMSSEQLLIFEKSNSKIEIQSNGNAKVLFGTAVKHPYPLISGYYSVHTNSKSLAEGEEKIRKIGLKMKKEGKI